MENSKARWLHQPLSNADVERLTHKLHQAGLIHSCMTCIHFTEHGGDNVIAGPIDAPIQAAFPAETCTLFNLRPPARVIAYGCERWDDVPF